ncbi:hypothetical protein [Microbacterium sp. KNMS]
MSLASQVTALAQRIANEFRTRFSPILTDAAVIMPGAAYPPAGIRAQKIGNVVTLQAIYSTAISPAAGENLFTLQPGLRPPSRQAGVAYSPNFVPTRGVSAFGDGIVQANGSGTMSAISLVIITT